MNRFKKVYCRAFQTAFKLALPFLPYRQPEVLQSLSEIPALFEKRKIHSVMLVTDRDIRKLGLTKGLEAALQQRKIACCVYDETVPNPTIDNVEAARALYLANGAQAIIAFGGGSSMDCAKAAGARIVKPGQSVGQMKGLLHVHRRLPLLVAVPTTAGTGSETTLAAVITDSQTHHKYPINDFSLIPHVARAGLHGDTGPAKTDYSYHRNGCADPCSGGLYRPLHHQADPADGRACDSSHSR